MQPPRRVSPPRNWRYLKIWEAVRNQALPELPKHFRSAIQISGIQATEIYTFGAVLSAAIEEEVVRTLNNLRDLWDPEQEHPDAQFVRQPQRFPDVLLIDRAREQILFGIELKSWYLLAKEGEPSFRFTVTPNACAPADLLVIVPWTLSFAVAGAPTVFAPFVESARYIAQYRNYWWQAVRQTTDDTAIRSPENAKPYPSARERIADVPVYDPGRNFGRIARIGIMDAYIQQCLNTPLLGIPIQEWRDFFRKASKLSH
jgi:hypothetical protein